MIEHALAKTIDFYLFFTNKYFVFRNCIFSIKMILDYVITEWFDILFFYLQNMCKIAINGVSHYIQCIYKLNLICILMFLEQHVMKKRSVIMGVIIRIVIDKTFIIIYISYLKYNLFPIHLFWLPKCVINMLLVPVYDLIWGNEWNQRPVS